MTVLTELCEATLAWTGVETSFAPGFPAKARADVLVTYIALSGARSTLALDVHYGVTLAAGSGIVTVTPISLPPPGELHIQRRTPAVHSNQFQDLVRYPQSLHEDLADRAAMRAAEGRRDIQRLLIDLSAVLGIIDQLQFNPEAYPAYHRPVVIRVLIDGQTIVPVAGGYVPGMVDILRNGSDQIIGLDIGTRDEDADVRATSGFTLVFPGGVLEAGDVIKVVKRTPFAAASPGLAENIDVTPAGGLLATNVQQALEQHHADIAERTTGPEASTDNAAARFDLATGKVLQNSVLLIGDTGALSRDGGGGIAVQGTDTNDAAAAGNLGQYVEKEIADPGVTLTTGVAASVGTISLTAGDWDVWGIVCYRIGAGTTASSLHGGINTSAALPSLPNGGAYIADGGPHTTAAVQIRPVGQRRLSLATTTTVHLIAYATFAAGAGASCYGGLYARRAR